MLNIYIVHRIQKFILLLPKHHVMHYVAGVANIACHHICNTTSTDTKYDIQD